jgi:hypothetical protein
MIDAEELVDLFGDADEEVQSEIVRMLEESIRPIEKKNYVELEREIKELKKQVNFWQELHSSAVRMQTMTHEFYERVVADQQRVIDRLRKKRRK